MSKQSDQNRPGDTIRADIRGGVSGSGQVAIGKNIKQDQRIGPPPATAEELAELRVQLGQVLSDLKGRVEAEAPPEKKDAALERVAELEAAVTAEKPDLTTMEYVKGWFLKNVPTVAGAVASVVVNPIVGKLVAAAGDGLAAEFRRRFGETDQS